MALETIAPTTHIGEIQLTVANLDRSVQFYQDRLGFALLNHENGQARLGTRSHGLINLVKQPGVKPRAQRGMTGLYHFAVLLPDRRSLARLLYQMAENEVQVQGAADHGVSEALYLADPDGNGIEFYRDRRRNEWPADDLGKLQMGTDELDVDDLVMELKDGVTPWTGLPDATMIGHVHLHVRDLTEAERFYTRILGFQVMQRYGSGALFVSAGGYHHHIGLNTWAGAGAPPPPPDVAGLVWFEVCLPDQASIDALKGRLEAAGIPSENLNSGLLVKDPSQNSILFKI